jgi:hypothetical protein
MSKSMSLKTGFIDLAAALFVIGGVVSLVLNILTIPIASLYPFQLPTSFGFVPAVVLVVSIIASLGAIHCYTLVSQRRLSEAGMRGIIFGALLLAFSLGLVVGSKELNTGIGALSAFLILIAGAISFVLRDSVLPRPPMVMQQPMFQRNP